MRGWAEGGGSWEQGAALRVQRLCPALLRAGPSAGRRWTMTTMRLSETVDKLLSESSRTAAASSPRSAWGPWREGAPQSRTPINWNLGAPDFSPNHYRDLLKSRHLEFKSDRLLYCWDQHYFTLNTLELNSGAPMH